MMKVRVGGAGAAGFALALASLTGGPVYSQMEVTRVVTTDVEVLTRGPVHEAFAETIVYEREPDVIVMKAPPDLIDEVPPSQAPSGANVAWIPGYWGWDEDRDDYLWVSGVWRTAPPGRQFVAGYWTRSGQGFGWTSGFWADANDNEIEYLPEPPAVVESVAPGPPPTPDNVWVQGTWVWAGGRYIWRPGNWVVANPNWMWVPTHYVSGPRGFVFVDGYWDFTVDRRGMLFAPVYVTAAVRATRVVYSPATVIDLAVFTDHLFVRPRYHHYYFGDYYAPSYAEVGIYPSFTIEKRRVAYDPIFAQHRWVHRADREWEGHVEADFRFRVEHQEARPPRTFALQINIGAQPQAVERRMVMAKSLTQLAAQPNPTIQLRAVAATERDVIVQHSKAVMKARDERKTVEEKEARSAGGEPVRVTAPVRAKLPSAPVAAKSVEVKEQAPPKKPEVSKTDASVQPKPQPVPAKKAPAQTAPPPTAKTAPLPPPAKKPDEATPPAAKKPTEPPPAAKKPAEPSPAPTKQPAEPPPPAAKKPTEPPPAAKKPTEPPPAAKKPAEPSPAPAKKPAEPPPPAAKKPAEPSPAPAAKKPTEPPPQAKKESPEKSKDKDKDDSDDESKDKPKKKKKDDDR
jgi:hypothetical protein